MIQKPRRGWWYLPGGKVDAGETWLGAAQREIREETGLSTLGMRLSGIHLVCEQVADGTLVDLRTIVQFTAARVEGELALHSREGKIAVVSIDQLNGLPMNDGDRKMIQYTLNNMGQEKQLFFGKFIYNSAEELLDWSITSQEATDEEGLL